MHNIRIVCIYDVDLLHKQTKKIMKKVEFVQEQKANDSWIFYYTTVDSMFVSESGSSDKETAYQKFIIISNGGSLSPIKTILETKTID